MVEAHEKVVEAQFGPQARAYVESAVHASGADLDAVEALVRELRPELALDLGAGGGHVAYVMARHARRVIAADLSREMLAAVAATARGKGLSNIETVEAPAERLPFEDSTFDFVASRFSAHHWRDFGAGLREARRALRRWRPGRVRRRLRSWSPAVRHASPGDRIVARPFARPRLHLRAMDRRARPVGLRHRGLPDLEAADGFPCLDGAHADA